MPGAGDRTNTSNNQNKPPQCIISTEKGNKREQKVQVAAMEVNICCSKLLGLSEQQFPAPAGQCCVLSGTSVEKKGEMLCLRGRGGIPSPGTALGGCTHSQSHPALNELLFHLHTQETASLSIKPENLLLFQRHSLKIKLLSRKIPRYFTFCFQNIEFIEIYKNCSSLSDFRLFILCSASADFAKAT